MRAICSLIAVGSGVGMTLMDGVIAKTAFFGAAILSLILALAIQLRREAGDDKARGRLDA